MPRYFFNIFDGGELVHDTEGSDLADLKAARYEAMETLTQMGREIFPLGRETALSIDITDDEGHALMHLALSIDVKAL